MYLKYLFILPFIILLSACFDEPAGQTKDSIGELVVYKSPTCGCCRKWINHIQDVGFETDIVNRNSLDSIKEQYGIEAKAQSCHTAIYNEQYVFEGHIPARLIKEFLVSPPEGAKGLTVPGMPTGSPGMESGNKFQPYKVWLMKETGGYEEYASIRNYDDQF